MTVEKSAPRINQVNFYYDEDGNVNGAAAHCTYELIEDGVVLTTHSQSVNLQSLAETDFQGLVGLAPVIRDHLVARDETASAARKAILEAAGDQPTKS